jgi:hypothetical protein
MGSPGSGEMDSSLSRRASPLVAPLPRGVPRGCFWGVA